ncbi:MAG TPA: LptF/LptG family permease [Verrucomicrobiae bacterium]|nr:LptF/LptG family permease [Verrucomicrobiae bacterium]
MKTLHLYLLRQVMASLVMTMLVFTFVLLIGNLLQEILPLLVNGEASFLMVGKALVLLIPFVFAFALPMAMLTSTLLVFGRFSADQELTAARASGISLISLASPILMLGLMLCGVSALINMYVAPRCRVAYNDLRFDMRSTLANFKIPEGYPIELPAQTNSDSYSIYTRRNRNNNLQDVVICQVKNETNVTRILAPSGHYEVDTNNNKLWMHLTNFTMLSPNGLVSGEEWPLSVDLKAGGKNTVSITDMTFDQLQDELRKWNHSAPLPLSAGRDPEPAKKKAAMQKALVDLSEAIRVQLHRQVAFSFACFGFTLIGIPLGIRVHRRETNIGVAMALGLVAVYYTFLLVGQSLSSHVEYAPHLMMWVPNLIFQAFGAVLLWRANRGI